MLILKQYADAKTLQNIASLQFLEQTCRKGYIFCRCFFFIFLFFFKRRLSSPRSSDANGAIFTKISGLVEGCKGLIIPLSFFIFQGTLPWQPVKVEKSAFFPDQSPLSLCRSETE